MQFFEYFIDAWNIFSRYWYVFLIKGAGYTLLLSLITVFFGTILGTVIAFGKMSRFKVLRAIVTAFVEIIRGTPILLQLYVGYFLVPQVVTFVEVSDFMSITIALILNSSAYVSEIIRSGIQSVDKGQTEAARSLGMSKNQTMFRIVIPQAVRTILPALGNEFVMMIKETSLASTFFIGDLMTSYTIVKGQTYKSLACLIIVGVIYFILTFPLSKLMVYIEKKLKRGEHHGQ